MDVRLTWDQLQTFRFDLLYVLPSSVGFKEGQEVVFEIFKFQETIVPATQPSLPSTSNPVDSITTSSIRTLLSCTESPHRRQYLLPGAQSHIRTAICNQTSNEVSILIVISLVSDHFLGIDQHQTSRTTNSKVNRQYENCMSSVCASGMSGVTPTFGRILTS